ncbi:hypothetical protein [Kineosporia succinea]|uniref:Secreted protein n=1 Tax=Kineosporia succinea TaxID=84632 RepID=A0ABT9PE08_9ACTN|nr:hypothetical protein [Kineosporia succinea]MDP9830731.1 hypothetical protein [Kineosporia succinea]
MHTLKRIVVLATAMSLVGLGSVGAVSASAAPAPTAVTGASSSLSPALGAAQVVGTSKVAKAARIKKTKIVALSPFRPSGYLKKAWSSDVRPGTAPTGDGGSDCSWSSVSALNDGTYECVPTVLGAAFCWASPKYPGRVLCLESAWSRHLRDYQASNLPRTHAPRRAQPLAMELSDGSRYELKTGGTYPARQDGLFGMYLCANKVCASKDKDLAILSAGGHGVNRSRAVWTVRVGEVGGGDETFPAPKRYQVRKAWFIRNDIR